MDFEVLPMAARPLLPAICLSLALTGLSAQTTTAPVPENKQAPAPAPDIPELSDADMKAYTTASRLSDPAKRIEALEKFKRDYPDSNLVSNADLAILSTLVKKLPDQQPRIRRMAKTLYRQAAAKDKGRIAGQIALQLLDGDLLLKDAEGYAKKSVADQTLPKYMQDQAAQFERRKQKPPSGDELQKRFRTSHASSLSTLGRIELKLGKTEGGQRLLEQAYTDNPDLVAAGAALGELAQKRGDEAKALEYLIPAKLSGRAPETAAAALDTVYKKTHGGSLAGFDAMLDAEYNKRYPNPVKTEPYQATEKRSGRMVLAEVFTGAGCGPCVAADLAFDAAMSRYSRKDLAVVMYHQHIPRPDPMTNPDTQTRAKSNSVNAVPTFQIDGKKTVGGGPRENTKNTYERFRPDLEKELEQAAEARIKTSASIAANTVRVAAAVDEVKSESKDLRVQIALVEKDVRYTGENGVRFHPMVVRAMGGEKGDGFAVEAEGAKEFEQSFDLAQVSSALKAHLDDYEAKGHRGESFHFIEKKYQIDANGLAVVVFVQDAKTKHVLQAAYADLASGSPHTVTEASR
jgi:thiol-disulfide isomerase/thioredoxin